MITDKPLVSILLAVYKPNENWLIEQLISLNEQNYENLNLYVYDDCPEHPVNVEVFDKYITKFEYKIIRGEVNKGSNKAFEELTKIADGDFFAYCDQDDVWKETKIKLLIETIEKEKSVLAYSDMAVIDEYGDLIAKTLKIIRPRLKYIEGENLYSNFFFSNCVAGCSMIVNGSIAKRAIPFSKVTVHDQWICIVSSYFGKISFLDDILVNYRIHGNNQTGILTGIKNKSDYYIKRVSILKNRSKELKRCINNIEMKMINNFCYSRINKNIVKIFKYKDLSPKEAYFEILIKYMPNWLFEIIINKLK